MIIFIHGEDTYRTQQRVTQLKEAFIKKYSHSGLNVVTLDGEDLTLSDFRNKCFSAGLLEKKRLIIIKNVVSQSSDKELLQGVLELIESKKFPKDNILIFWEGSLNEEKPKKGEASLKGALLKTLAKERAERFELLSIDELKKWTLKEIKERRGKIESGALEELVSKVGQDLWQMNNEIEKLVNYCSGRQIARQDVVAFVQSKFDENIFHLTDALGQRQKKQALKLIHDQLASGAEPLLLLSKFIWQFRNLIQIKEMIRQGRTSAEITKELKLHPFVVQKTVPQANRFSEEELKEIYSGLLEIDFKLKNSDTAPALLFDLLVMKVCD
ncbi:MAG: DNA polymerase III subunit delta [Candidatus Kerfeldbacteria bacterium CG08_land_8_20_14_0_20_40_16]|uniref:DNA polymerase III subunit delta n=1 Tax=Candidatus Kerfeldbacteria bacterium CG08_land_8_20_14_0_20_40_16 TaxID=2014244 RepID=A0A2H0YX68_9BACT|nr:MAG: DNA polymerase III subunit delta [Candidatus Kerfeldbacteria bacterium CG08_land_8_20_14_0_20_40_16]